VSSSGFEESPISDRGSGSFLGACFLNGGLDGAILNDLKGPGKPGNPTHTDNRGSNNQQKGPGKPGDPTQTNLSNEHFKRDQVNPETQKEVNER
jgi:hypothetical protein